ncbi:sulfatase-like hydrolase/transferase [Haloferula rosea]|uniref:Sulfatase-like hydrolase/transferase n=1 Tax=Haloferula rosea TaxID=490093 RepID=A0A934RC01_9BACT|nr:sulfatase-like hydrolase/transferase [Haloferula rosea]MBK1828307.1 sulfatase-like hydrolase/transferase [Haloferula rosea]
MTHEAWHRLFIWTLCLGLISAATAHSAELREPSKPNIILVFIDDMGWSDFSCFGNKDASTPEIDRLASEGIVFEQFYVNSPICSPSRVAVSTGTYPQRWGITSYLGHRKQNEERGQCQWLDPKAPMLARDLKQAGYATGHFGKWHMGGQRDVTDAPEITAYGFDESLTNFEGMGAKLLPLTRKPDGTVGKIWQDAERLGQPVTWMQRSEITTGFVDAALAFIDQSVANKKPFSINLWPDDVHSPFWPPVDEWGDGSKRHLYLSVLESMDQQLGRLFDRIRNDRSLRSNTMILVCSDNGPEKGAGMATPLKGYKTHLYEGGIRSPLVVWGPGLIAPSTVGTRNTKSVFSAIDLVPSLARIASAPPGVSRDGEDISATLLGKSDESRTAPLFFSRPPDRKNHYGFKNLPDLAVRDGRWKLLCDFDGGRPELHDLTEDPGESKNLAAQHPEKREELTQLVRNWYRSVTQP